MQSSSDAQTTASPATHLPLEHVSNGVQRSLSSHVVPFAFGVTEHSPVAASADMPTIGVPKDDVEKITKIEIKNADKSHVLLEKKGDAWELVQPVPAKANAAVGYYGVYLTEHLNEVIRCPLMLHIAGADEFVPPEAQKQLHAALDRHAKATLYDYPGLGHAFAREGGKHWDAPAAKTANARTLTFFNKHLG